LGGKPKDREMHVDPLDGLVGAPRVVIKQLIEGFANGGERCVWSKGKRHLAVARVVIKNERLAGSV
jgi:hypothetical protein